MEEKEKKEQAKPLGLVCYVCGGKEFRYEHCKVFCLKCGLLIENCSGD